MPKKFLFICLIVGCLTASFIPNSFAGGKAKPVPIPTLTPRSAFSGSKACQLNPTVPLSPPFSLGYSRDIMWAPTHGTDTCGGYGSPLYLIVINNCPYFIDAPANWVYLEKTYT